MLKSQVSVVLVLVAVYVKSISALNNRGMTWEVVQNIENHNMVKVGCDGCNPYEGDTSCNQSLPILCVSDTDFNRPPYSPPPCHPCTVSKEFYNGWSGGYIAITPPVVGLAIRSLLVADQLCKNYLGPDFIAVHQHVGKYVEGMSNSNYCFNTWPSEESGLRQIGGWNAYGYGRIINTGRLWAFTYDQPSNCWN